MKIQAYLTAFVVNTKRIVKLVTEKQAIFQIGLLGLIQKMDMIENKEKGAYYFINNKLLFQWPLFGSRHFLLTFSLLDFFFQVNIVE